MVPLRRSISFLLQTYHAQKQDHKLKRSGHPASLPKASRQLEPKKIIEGNPIVGIMQPPKTTQATRKNCGKGKKNEVPQENQDTDLASVETPDYK